MNRLTYVQLYKENEEHFNIASTLWLPFIEEVNGHDGAVQSKAQILDGLRKRIAIQGMRKDMHFEVALWNDTAIGIAMFAVDLGTVYGLLEQGYGTVMGFYIHPAYRRKGFGTEFWLHMESLLRADGATKFYLCPDSVTGLPFWKSLGFVDSGLTDPDDQKPIYTKPALGAAMAFIQLNRSDPASCAAFSRLIPAYMKELDGNAGRVHRPEWAAKWAESMLDAQGDPDRHLEVCYVGGNLVGFLYGKRDHPNHPGYIRPGWGYILEFYVLPEYRRKGYGRRMYKRLEALFRKDGITQVYLTADPVSGKPFWEAIGFTDSGDISVENKLDIYEKYL